MSGTDPQRPEVKKGIGALLGRLSPRTKSVLSGVAAVLLLAGVIFGASALSAPQSTRPLNTTLGTSEGDTLYQDALTALSSGDTTQAIVMLEKVVEADPANQQAQRALDSARSSAGGASTSSDPDPVESNEPADPADGQQSAPAPAPTAEDPAFGKATDDLAALLPPAAAGYSLGTPTVVGDDATVSGTAGDPELLSSRAQWSVHHRASKSDAQAFVEQTSKSLYPKNGKTVSIDGASAYFGTDGTRFATVVYVRGRYVFEVVLTTLDGKPSALNKEAGDAAKAFPDNM